MYPIPVVDLRGERVIVRSETGDTAAVNVLPTDSEGEPTTSDLTEYEWSAAGVGWTVATGTVNDDPALQLSLTAAETAALGDGWFVWSVTGVRASDGHTVTVASKSILFLEART